MLAGAVALAFLVDVDDHLNVGEFRLPGLCTFRNVTGLPCAGCGLTRSWVVLAQGDPAASVTYHRLGWVLMLYVVLQALRHGAWLVVARWRSAVEGPGRWLDRGLVAIAVLMLVDWAVTLVQLQAGR